MGSEIEGTFIRKLGSEYINFYDIRSSIIRTFFIGSFIHEYYGYIDSSTGIRTTPSRWLRGDGQIWTGNSADCMVICITIYKTKQKAKPWLVHVGSLYSPLPLAGLKLYLSARNVRHSSAYKTCFWYFRYILCHIYTDVEF